MVTYPSSTCMGDWEHCIYRRDMKRPVSLSKAMWEEWEKTKRENSGKGGRRETDCGAKPFLFLINIQVCEEEGNPFAWQIDTLLLGSFCLGIFLRLAWCDSIFGAPFSCFSDMGTPWLLQRQGYMHEMSPWHKGVVCQDTLWTSSAVRLELMMDILGIFRW